MLAFEHKSIKTLALSSMIGVFSSSAVALELNPEIGVVLEGLFHSGETALSGQSEGFSLGHNEITLSSPIDDLFHGRLTSVLETHDGEVEVGLEEAFVETTALPFYMTVKAGRFLSQVGYLNSRHTHEDDFIGRPMVYRAFLGNHYFDDGLRVNLLMPVSFYWQVGAEAFNGSQLIGSGHEEQIGVYTLSTKFGSDINPSSSWQGGLSYLGNRLTNVESGEEEHDHSEDALDDHGHEGHNHSAAYSGRHIYIADFVWKWAPNGNSKEKQWVFSTEYLRANHINQYADSEDYQSGWYGSLVHKFAPSWSAGYRYGEVTLKQAHEDHFDDQSSKEHQVSLTWARSHFSSVRLTYSAQDSVGFNPQDDHSIGLQFLMSFGAHGAHEY
jgi:hypothetical protein